MKKRAPFVPRVSARVSVSASEQEFIPTDARSALCRLFDETRNAHGHHACTDNTYLHGLATDPYTTNTGELSSLTFSLKMATAANSSGNSGYSTANGDS